MGIVHVNVYFDWFREYFFWWIKIFLMTLQALLFSLMGGLLLDLKIQFFCLHHENTLLLCNGTVTKVKLKWCGMWVLLTVRLYNWYLTHHSSPCTCDSPVDMLPCTKGRVGVLGRYCSGTQPSASDGWELEDNNSSCLAMLV